MKEVKLFEVRDKATFMPVMGVRVSGDGDPLLRRAGFGPDPLVILVPLEGACGHRWQYNPYDWPGNERTIPEAHLYIQRHWDELPDGAVVDVEYILGETKMPQESEVEG